METKQQNNSTFLGSLQSEVASEASPMLEFITRHVPIVVSILVCFILAIFGFWFYENQSKKTLEDQRLELGKIIATGTTSERLIALEKYLPTAPSSTRMEALFAIVRATLHTKQYDKAYDAWKQIQNLNEDMKIVATFGMANALVQQGKKEEALSLYEELLPKVKAMDLTNVNKEILMLSRENGDYQRAIIAAEALLASTVSEQERLLWSQMVASMRQQLLKSRNES